MVVLIIFYIINIIVHKLSTEISVMSIKKCCKKEQVVNFYDRKV
jgi:hypothetical protein